MTADTNGIAVNAVGCRAGEEGDGFRYIHRLATLLQRVQATTRFPGSERNRSGHLGFDEAWGNRVDGDVFLGQDGGIGRSTSRVNASSHR